MTQSTVNRFKLCLLKIIPPLDINKKCFILSSFALMALLLGPKGVFASPSFLFHSPAVSLSKPAPLVVVLHGFSSSAEDIEKITGFSHWADKKGFYVLYPEMNDQGDWSKCWPYFLPEEQRAEGAVTQQIVQKIKSLVREFPIDPQQIFLVGMSAGASMGGVLVACHPELFRGVAFHSGTSYGLSSSWTEALLDLKSGPPFWRVSNKTCDPSLFKGKVMVFHGRADELVNERHVGRLEADFLKKTQTSEKAQSETDSQMGYVVRDHWRDKEQIGRVVFVERWPHFWSGQTLPEKEDEQGQPLKPGPNATDWILRFFFEAPKGAGKR